MRRGETPAREIPLKICWIGGARYGKPLDDTTARKFRALRRLGALFVVGFSRHGWPAAFEQDARFILLPRPPLPFLRHLALPALGLPVLIWLILKRGVEVIVAQGPYEAVAGAIAKQLMRSLGRRVGLVVESHGDFENSLFFLRRVPFAGIYRWAMRRSARYSFRHADALRAVSHFTQAQLEAWAPGKPVFRFIAWTDFDLFLSIPRGVPVERSVEILYVGVLTPLKGVHFLVEAFSRLAETRPEARLVLVGCPEDRRYSARLIEMAGRPGLDGRVSFLGPLPASDVADRMARARALVLPSLSEALGRVLVEALACGTPVIGSRVGGIPEIVSDGLTGRLMEPGDVAALYGCLQWMMDHPDGAAEMGRRGRALVASRFSADRYVEEYGRICEAARAAAGLPPG